MSEARADLPPAASAMGLRSALPPPGGDVVLPTPNVGPPAPVPPIPADNAGSQQQPAAGNDPLAPVMARISKGETGGNADPYTAKYGGGNFGFPDWEGRPGPAGTSHAAGKYQFEPATWNKAAGDMMAHGLPKPDFNKPEDQERVARFWAVKRYHDATGRNLIEDAQQNRVDYSALTGEWPSLSPNHLGNQLIAPNGSFARERMAAFDQETDQLAKQDRAEYERLRNEPDPTAKERAELLADARERARHSREVYEDLAKNPPPEKPIDALTNFGSISTILMTLIGGMGRHHLNGALMAAGAMMQAAQANNHEQFERQYKIWDHQSNTALHLSQLESDEVRSLLEDKRMSENERQARLHAFFEEHQMTWQAQQLRANQLDHILTSETELERLRANAAYQKLMTGQMLLQTWAQAHPNATPDEYNAEAAALGVVGGRGAAAGAGAGAGQFSKDAIDALVQQAMTVGPAGIMPSLPRSGPARSQFENAFAERLKQEPGGIEAGTAKVIMNQMRMAEAKAAATTAGHVTMNTELYSQEAAGAGQLLKDASKAFPRSNFTTFNQALAAFETKTGDERIIRFGTALNSLVNAYGKMTNPTGTGIHDADKESLRKIIDTSLSHGQIEAGVDQVLAEGRNVSMAAQHAQEEVLRRIVPGATSPTTEPAASSNGVPVPAEHASDPDGTPYSGSDGKTYVKRGNQMVPQ